MIWYFVLYLVPGDQEMLLSSQRMPKLADVFTFTWFIFIPNFVLLSIFFFFFLVNYTRCDIIFACYCHLNRNLFRPFLTEEKHA